MTQTNPPAPQEMKTRIGASVLFSFLTQLLGTVVSLIALPYLVRGLGDQAYGALAVLVAFTSYFAFLDFGISAAYVRELAVAIAQGDLERAQRLYETVFSIFSRLALVALAVMPTSGALYSWLILEDKALWREVCGALLIYALMSFFGLLLTAPRCIPGCSFRPDLQLKVLLPLQILIPLGQILALSLGGSLIAVVGVQAVWGTSATLLMYLFARRLQPTLILRRRFHPEIWAELRTFSAWKFLTTLFQQGQNNGDRILLSLLRPVEELSMYSVANSVALKVRLVFMLPMQGPFFSVSAEAFARGGAQELFMITERYCRRTAIAMALMSAGVCYMAAPVFVAWLGEEYVKEGVPILCVAAITVSLASLCALIGQAMDVSKHPNIGAQSAGIGLAGAILASISLSALGPLGVALGFLLGGLSQLLFLIYRFCAITRAQAPQSEAQLSWVALLMKSLLGPSLVGGLSFFLMSLLPAESIGGSLLYGLFCCVPGLGLGFLLRLISRQDVSAVLPRWWATDRPTQ